MSNKTQTKTAIRVQGPIRIESVRDLERAGYIVILVGQK